MKKILLLILSLWTVGGCQIYAQKIAETSDAKVVIMDDIFSVRQNEFSAFVDSFRYVVENTKDMKASEGFALFETQTNIVVPVDNGVIYSPQDKIIKPLMVIILTPADTKFSLWKKYLDDTDTAASFNPKAKALILKNVANFSLPYKGSAIAHEMEHARIFLENPKRVITLAVYAGEETAMFIYQNGLIAKMGGESYQKVLQDEIHTFSGGIRQKGEEISFAVPVYNEGLDKIFGKPLSSEEKDFRTLLLWIDSAFHHFDVALGEKDAGNIKQQFIQSLYQNQAAEYMPKE